MTTEELSALNEEILSLYPDRQKIHERLLSYSTKVGECVRLFTVKPPHPDYFCLQGGCTDGKNLYLAFTRWMKNGDGWDKDLGTMIVRVDAASGEVLQKSENLVLHHSNDFVYLPERKELIAVHNRPCRNTISVIDADTLTLKEDRVIERDIFSIAYNEKRRLFAAGKSGGKNFAFFDENFRPVRDFTGVETKYVTQGMTSDDDALYFLQFHNNCLMKYDWNGDFKEYIPLVKDTEVLQEPEHLYFVNGRLLVTYGIRENGKPMAEVCEVHFKNN